MKKVALIGFGAIARSIVELLQQDPEPKIRLVAVCARPAQLAECRAAVSQDTLVTDRFDDIWQVRPDAVIEAAGHGAVAAHGGDTVGNGCDLYVLSTGILADDAVRTALVAQATAGGGRIMIPSGALAGFDGLLAMRQSGLRAVTYTSTKPPGAWTGTEAERICDLAALTVPEVFFVGSAKEAALRYPRNSNLAAAVAFAGLGLDRTEVRLVADPTSLHNVGHLFAESDLSLLDVKVSGAGFGSNPKTSAITGMSVLAALGNQESTIRFV